MSSAACTPHRGCQGRHRSLQEVHLGAAGHSRGSRSAFAKGARAAGAAPPAGRRAARLTSRRTAACMQSAFPCCVAACCINQPPALVSLDVAMHHHGFFLGAYIDSVEATIAGWLETRRCRSTGVSRDCQADMASACYLTTASTAARCAIAGTATQTAISSPGVRCSQSRSDL